MSYYSTASKAVFSVLIFFFIPPVLAEQHEDRRPFEAAQRVLDTLSTVAPRLPEVGSKIVRLQNFMDISLGKKPPPWRDPESLLGRVVGGKWLVNFCADTYVPPSISNGNSFSLFAYSPIESEVEYSYGGREESQSGKFGWEAAKTFETKGRKYSTISVTLDRDHYTLITLRGKNRKGEPCATTIKVRRNGNTLELFRVSDVTDSLPESPNKTEEVGRTEPQTNMDPYGFGAWLNDYRRQHGLGPLAYDPYLDRFASSNNSAQLSRNTVGHFDLDMPYGTVTLQNASRRTSAYAALYGDGAYDSVGWVHSPHHNEALLDRQVTRYGFSGVSAAGLNSGRPASDSYWTLELTSKPGDKRNPDGSLSLAP